MIDSTELSLKNRVRTVNSGRVSFQLFKEFVDGTPWEIALGDKGAEGSWQLLKDVCLRAPELSISMSKKSGKEDRRHAWLRKDPLVKLKWKKEMRRQWNWRYVAWEE